MDDPLKTLRRRFRAWRSESRLRREFRTYQEKFVLRGLSIPDETQMSRIIGERFPGLSPRAKGTLRTIAVYHHYNWENHSLLPSLQKFGPVRHYDWGARFDHSREESWHASVKKEMNRDLAERVRSWVARERADVIFTYLSGALVFPETLRSLRDCGVPLVNLSLNDKENFVGKIRRGLAMGSRDICRCFDLCCTSTEDALAKYVVEGAVPLYLPEGANPDVHRPHDLAKTVDVSFIGQCYGNRRETIERLRQRGVAVEAYGHGWPAGPLSAEEMVRMYSRSRINLGFGGVMGHRETYCLKGRDFEIPMSGGLYLTEHHPELERFYEIGTEIVTWTDHEDLVKKIRYLLSHPEEAEAIRQKGFRRARAEHTWEMRFEKIFRLIGLI
ncbi:MAG: Spore protein YkvP [Syntrophaceae bacterium PtaU1.Bin231]|nr:MAG: Spore protein YkvP [Syntrophaceae bacterium PtaU1.Bin231]